MINSGQASVQWLMCIYFMPLQAVSADGCSLVDLLDTYMKNCADRSIKPLGGELFLKYDEPWNPPRKHKPQGDYVL